MSHVQTTLRRELEMIDKRIKSEHKHIEHLNEEVDEGKRTIEKLTSAKQELISTLNVMANRNDIKLSNNKCDVCDSYLAIDSTIEMPITGTELKDERCPCCG